VFSKVGDLAARFAPLPDRPPRRIIDAHDPMASFPCRRPGWADLQ
jgi:hypothetical protein